MTGQRHQLAAYSPLSVAALLRGARESLGGGGDIDGARALVAREYSADNVLLVDSGRSALQVAIEVALSAGDPARSRVVALPAFQCYEVAAAAVGADCRIALYDVDPRTLAPDLDSLASVVRQSAAVVIAPLYGIPVDWEAVSAVLNAAGAVPIEDAAQGHGGSWRGSRLGSLGSLSVVSFGRGKGWTAGGGGALCARGPIAKRLDGAFQPGPPGRGLRSFAITAIQWAAGRPSLYGIPASIPALGLGETRYHDPASPAPMSAFSAALLPGTLVAAREEGAARRRMAAVWRQRIPVHLRPGLIEVLDDAEPGYIRFPMRVNAASAGSVLRGESRRLGIAQTYPRTLGSLEAVIPRLVGRPATPGAHLLSQQLITLPTHSLLTEADVRRILDRCEGFGPP